MIGLLMAFVTAAIPLGPLGPIQNVQYADHRVHAHLSYRTASDQRTIGSEADNGPIVASGSLRIQDHAKQYTYDFRSLFDGLYTVPEGSLTCGAGPALSRSGHYLIVQAIEVGKGCLGVVRFIDLDSGYPVTNVMLDHPKSDDPSNPYISKTVKILGYEKSVVPISQNSGLNYTYHWLIPSPYIIILTQSQKGTKEFYAMYCIELNPKKCGATVLPPLKTFVRVGRFKTPTLRYYIHEAVLRIDK
jgi:hypothetical protein